MTRRQASSSLFAYMQQMSLHHCLCPTKRDQNTFIAHLGGGWVVAMRSSAQARLTNIIRQIFVLTYLLSTFSSSTYISVFRGKKEITYKIVSEENHLSEALFYKKDSNFLLATHSTQFEHTMT